MSVTLTPTAAKEVQKVITDQSFPDGTLLRIGVAGGGCSGFEYKLGFDQAVDEEKDLVTDQHGVKVAIDKKSALFLDGTEIDFHESIEKRGFTFNNPNAKNSCGCGSSFSA